ncbi:hypothetical protein niasHS_009335 [Heterodera schachtii]|uniref:Uncharacterized protein n=1 Tax=Heterodera schachtii TaxID=97005 RepID=A0ABD2JBQ2_HETSC
MVGGGQLADRRPFKLGTGLKAKHVNKMRSFVPYQQRQRFRTILLTKVRNQKVLATALSQLLHRQTCQFNQRHVLRDNVFRRYVMRRDEFKI